MKTLIRCTLSALLYSGLTFTAPAFAGGVSDGGGGTTNPKPADPEWIAQSVHFDAAIILTAWFNRQEQIFVTMSDELKPQSPFYKMFTSDKNIFDLIKVTKVELQFSIPCYDKNGNPWDGSVYTSEPGSVCLSPFTMAPKLNKYNVKVETYSLLAHELSHLLGTTEEEADAIQEQAIADLYQVNFVDEIVEFDLLSKGNMEVGELLVQLNYDISSAKFLRDEDFDRSFDSYGDFAVRLGDKNILLPVRFERFKLVYPEFVRFYLMRDFVCSNDQSLIEEMRKVCMDNLNSVFLKEYTATARDYHIRNLFNSHDPGEVFDLVTIRRPAMAEDVAAELTLLLDYVKQIQADLQSLVSSQMEVVRFP